MLRKIISLLCAFCLFFTLASCNEATTSSDADNESVVSQQTPSKEEETQSTVSSKPVRDKTLWKRKMVAITIDDGPKDCTEKLLDGLKEKGIKVSFFLLGQNIDARPELVKRMVDEGHSIGWHSYDHSISATSRDTEVEKSFKSAQETLNKHQIDYTFKFYRNPGGQKSEIIDKYATEYGFRIFEWSNGSFNDKLPTAQAMCDSTFDGTVTNGTVILIHDYNEKVVDGILLLVDRLVNEGFEPVNLDELIKRRNGGNAGEHYGSIPLY